MLSCLLIFRIYEGVINFNCWIVRTQIQPTYLLMLTSFFFLLCMIMVLYYIECVWCFRSNSRVGTFPKMSVAECVSPEEFVWFLCCNPWCCLHFSRWTSSGFVNSDIIKLPKWIRRWTSKKHLRWKVSNIQELVWVFVCVCVREKANVYISSEWWTEL